MLRNAAAKVAWVGRTASMVLGLALVMALVFGVATTALAAIPGDPFRLGKTNGIDAVSSLVGNVAGPMLRVDNSSTGAGATALELRVEAGKAPLKVNSPTKVAKLNADKVDGHDAPLWAYVDPSSRTGDVLIRGNGVARVSPEVYFPDPDGPPVTYAYWVTFNQDISNCVYLATQGQDHGGYQDPGEVSTSFSNNGPGPDGHDVYVQFGDSDGGGDFFLRPFYLGVLC